MQFVSSFLFRKHVELSEFQGGPRLTRRRLIAGTPSVVLEPSWQHFVRVRVSVGVHLRGWVLDMCIFSLFRFLMNFSTNSRLILCKILIDHGLDVLDVLLEFLVFERYHFTLALEFGVLFSENTFC